MTRLEAAAKSTRDPLVIVIGQVSAEELARQVDLARTRGEGIVVLRGPRPEVTD